LTYNRELLVSSNFRPDEALRLAAVPEEVTQRGLVALKAESHILGRLYKEVLPVFQVADLSQLFDAPDLVLLNKLTANVLDALHHLA